jgi:hypothetical protein
MIAKAFTPFSGAKPFMIMGTLHLPADPARRHVEDRPAVSLSTAQMLACTATLSLMRYDHVLDAA